MKFVGVDFPTSLFPSSFVLVFWVVVAKGEQMNPATQLYLEPNEVDDRLAQLGLTRFPFVRAAQEGFAAFASCTASHPPTFPGTFAWAESNRSLRDSLFESRFTRKNETNQPLVISEDG